jgi:hypothetical protein
MKGAVLGGVAGACAVAVLAVLVAGLQPLVTIVEQENYYCENVPFEYHTRWQVFTEDVEIEAEPGFGYLTQNWTDLTVWVYNDDSEGGTFKVVIPTYDSGDGWTSHEEMAGSNKYIASGSFDTWDFSNYENFTDSQKYELPRVVPPTRLVQIPT